MKSTARLIAALVAGFAGAFAIAYVAFETLRALWPEYAAAEPTRDYTLAMMFSRLALAALCTGGAACIATLVAGDEGRAAVWLGALFVVFSLPSHLHYVWDAYPAWYHFVYLAGLIPIAWFSARALRAIAPARTHDATRAA